MGSSVSSTVGRGLGLESFFDAGQFRVFIPSRRWLLFSFSNIKCWFTKEASRGSLRCYQCRLEEMKLDGAAGVSDAPAQCDVPDDSGHGEPVEAQRLLLGKV